MKVKPSKYVIVFFISIDTCISQPLDNILNSTVLELQERKVKILIKIGSHLYVTNCDFEH